jgi:hypothetical protein
MKFSTRGKAFMAALLALAFAAFLYQDPLLLTAFLVLALLIVGETVWMQVVIRRPTRWFSLSLDAEGSRSVVVSKVLYPGQTANDDLYFTKKVGGRATLGSGLQFLKLSPCGLAGRSEVTKVKADFVTPFAGDYASRTMELGVTGPLGILSAATSLPAEVAYSVMPRVVEVAITSAKLLGKGGIGEFPIDKPGIGTEYYESREYQSGDDYRKINWKASARLGELIVNEHMKEVGAAYYLVLEAVSPDYFDRDRLAATFLGLGNALTTLGVRFGVVVHDGKRVKRLKKLDTPPISLAYALKAALDFVDLKGTFPEDELAVTPSLALRPLQQILAGSGMMLLSQIEDFAMSEKREIVQNQEVFETIMDLVREDSSEPPAILYVSGLFGSVEPVVELGSRVKRIYGADFVVADPTAPWVAAGDERSAYDAYLGHTRKLRALHSAAIEYQTGEPLGLVQRLLSA